MGESEKAKLREQPKQSHATLQVCHPALPKRKRRKQKRPRETSKGWSGYQSKTTVVRAKKKKKEQNENENGDVKKPQPEEYAFVPPRLMPVSLKKTRPQPAFLSGETLYYIRSRPPKCFGLVALC